MYCDSPSHPKGPVADAYERTLVAWLPLHHGEMTPERLALTLARTGEIPFDDPGGGFSAVASILTRAVWEVASDRVLEKYGMTNAIQDDIDHRAARMRAKFCQSYDPPPVRSVAGFAAHAELARIAAVVRRSRQQRLLEQVAAVAPEVAHRARCCVDVFAAVDLEAHATIRDALSCVHDQGPTLWASVVVAEPETGRQFGDGVFRS